MLTCNAERAHEIDGQVGVEEDGYKLPLLSCCWICFYET
jgi:hypothetical protein